MAVRSSDLKIFGCWMVRSRGWFLKTGLGFQGAAVGDFRAEPMC